MKTDGTFWGSNGAADNYCEKMRFLASGHEYDALGYSESSWSNNDLTISYFINNKPVAEESFNSFCKEQDKKKDAVWHEFSQKNIETELINYEFPIIHILPDKQGMLEIAVRALSLDYTKMAGGLNESKKC